MKKTKKKQKMEMIINDDGIDAVNEETDKDNNKHNTPIHNDTSSIYAIPDYSIFSSMLLARKRAVLYLATAGVLLVAVLWAVMSRKHERAVDVDMGFDFSPASNRHFNAANFASSEELRELDYQPWKHKFDYVNVTGDTGVDSIIRDLRSVMHEENLSCLTPAYYTKENVPNIFATRNGYVFINVHNVTGTNDRPGQVVFRYQSKLHIGVLYANVTFNHDDDQGVPTRITSEEYERCFQIYYHWH